MTVTLRRRTVPERLRYLAAKLQDGEVSPVILALLVLADEIEAAS